MWKIGRELPVRLLRGEVCSVIFEKSQTYKMPKKAGKCDKHGHAIVIFSQAKGQTWCHTSAYYLSIRPCTAHQNKEKLC